jgi:NADPH2:quinone reductase
MQAIQLQSLDGPSALKLVDIRDPIAADDEVLVEVRAAGVSFADVLVTRGTYQERLAPPVIQGFEIAGVVRSAPAASAFAPGDRVASVLPHGGFAELAAAPLAMTFRLPEAFSYQEGAAFIVNYHAVHVALVRRARLRSGERVLVHGSTGGVGTAAIQVAKAMGCTVVAVVRSPEKSAVAQTAGADEVVLIAKDGTWLESARSVVSGGAFDVAVDPVGGGLVDDTVRALAPEGRYAIVGFASGEIPAVRFNRLLLRNIDLVGAGWEGILSLDPTVAGRTDRALAEMVTDGFVRPIVGASYPMHQAAQALIDVDQGRAIGKLVLDVGSTSSP